MSEITATFVKDVSDKFKGSALLWKLSKPVGYGTGWTADEPYGHTVYVVTSATTVLGEPETYMFPADPDGEVKDWSEMNGSLKGTLEHEDVIAAAGWTIIERSDK